MFLSLAKELDLSKEDLSKFEADAAKIGENFNEQLVKLQRKHDQQILDVLPTAASKRARELLGRIYLKY